ncbi:hypothetical protein HY745_08425 [Candidatus Desantisbacteria bacterium]|nr:hypothetical protein [Candidatus Desantisbacteria bacterium]
MERKNLVGGPLANIAVRNPLNRYIADKIYPIVDVYDPKAKIPKYLRADWFRNDAGKRAETGRAPRSTYKMTETSISTTENCHATPVPDKQKDYQQAPNAYPLRLEENAINHSTNKVDLAREIICASSVLDATWCGVAAGEDAEGKWAAGTGNTFLVDIANGIEQIFLYSGVTPDLLRLFVDFMTFNQICKESTVLAMMSHTERAIVTEDILAKVLKIKDVVVAYPIENTAKETKAGTEFTNRLIWEKNAGKGSAFLVYNADETPGLEMPMAGVQARLVYASNGLPRATYTYYEDAEHQQVYEVAEEIDIRQVDSGLGYLWKDTRTT